MRRSIVAFLLLLAVHVRADDAAVIREVESVNQQLIRALAERDRATVDRIYADSFRRVSVEGRVLAKADILAALDRRDAAVTTKYVSEPSQAVVYGDTVILIYGSTRMTTRDAKTESLHYRVTDTYVRTPDGWKKVLSTGTPIAD